MNYPTELVAKAEFELRVFERVSQETSKELLDEVKRHRASQEQAQQPSLTDSPLLMLKSSEAAQLSPSAMEVLKRGAKGMSEYIRDQGRARASLPAVPLLASQQPSGDGCNYCKHPLFAGTKCDICGRVPKYEQQPSGGEVVAEPGTVYVDVSGFTGTGKSAVAGEIEIAMRAIGLQVEWVDGQAEKNMTGADWAHALEMYKPRVVIRERNIPLTLATPKPEPMTDDEMWALWNAQGIDDMTQHEAIAFARAVEAHHGITKGEA